jgi:hypothetical protein
LKICFKKCDSRAAASKISKAIMGLRVVGGARHGAGDESAGTDIHWLLERLKAEVIGAGRAEMTAVRRV